MTTQNTFPFTDISRGRPEVALPSEAILGVIEFEMADQKVKPTRERSVNVAILRGSKTSVKSNTASIVGATA